MADGPSSELKGVRQCRFGGRGWLDGAWASEGWSHPDGDSAAGCVNRKMVRAVRDYNDWRNSPWPAAAGFAVNESPWFCNSCRKVVEKRLKLGAQQWARPWESAGAVGAGESSAEGGRGDSSSAAVCLQLLARNTELLANVDDLKRRLRCAPD